MKVRDSKEMAKVLKRKGFELFPEKNHHKFFFLIVDGKKTSINTYFSHNGKDYDKNLMSKVKKQLRFHDNKLLDDFFDCPLSKESYIQLLKDQGDLR